jgi:hypothetical protein
MILKISLLGICVCILVSLMKSSFKEAVLPLELAFAVVVLIVTVGEIKELTSTFRSFLGDIQIDSTVFSALMKGAVICIVSKLSSDVAKDSGNSLVSDVIDLTGRVLLITISFPFLESVIKIAAAFLP